MVVRSGITILFQAPATLLRTSQVLGVDRLSEALGRSSRFLTITSQSRCHVDLHWDVDAVPSDTRSSLKDRSGTIYI